MNNDNDSVAACMDHILMALNIIADMAQNDPKRREEIAGEEIGLCQIISRTELVQNVQPDFNSQHRIRFYDSSGHPQKVSFGELRASGVRDVLVYCRDHN